MKAAEPEYDVNAPLVPVEPRQVRKFAVHHNEMVLATWNCGWSCEGAGLFQGGCASGYNQYYQTWNVKGYFDKEGGICLCLKCAEKADNLDNVPKWYGYYKQGDSKHPTPLKVFFFSQNVIFGNGEDEVGQFYIKGELDTSTNGV
jgi:hypothetical protein